MLARLGRLLTSLRTSAVLLGLLSLLLLLNVLLPQSWLVDAGQYEEAIRNSKLAFHLLETLGFGNMATSPVFLAVLGLFFVNLLGVLIQRATPTFRRTRLRPPSEQALLRRATGRDAVTRPRPERWSAREAQAVLKAAGYPAVRVGETGLWGVKHRRAAVGFLLFHVSFFVMAAGGVALWYTRFVGEVTLVEGQAFTGDWGAVVRAAPAGTPEVPRFTLEAVEPRLEDGFTVHLGYTVSVPGSHGAAESYTGRINDPVVLGATTFIANEAGLAPQLWLQDAHGYTLDRVAVAAPTRGGAPTEVSLAGGAWAVELLPLQDGRLFPEQPARASFPVALRILHEGAPAFEGALAPGQWADAGGGARLVLEDLRYWTRLRVVHERGGDVLVAGFLLGVLGLVWRQLFYRREVGLTWDETSFTLFGRTDYFPWRFRRELETLAELLAAPDAGAGPQAPPTPAPDVRTHEADRDHDSGRTHETARDHEDSAA